VRRIDGQRGQATVELALITPLLMLFVLCIVQVALVARDQVLVVHAARAGARAAAVEPVGAVATDAVMASSSLDPSRTDVRLEVAGRRVTVTVTHRSSTVVSLVGRLIDDVTLSASATFRLE
jgi:Flp pilus assembly protein TadG